MSILKVSSSNINSPIALRAKPTVLINVFLMTMFILAALDLLVASLRGDSLAIYTMFLFLDLILTIIGIVFCSDLLIRRSQKLISCFYVTCFFYGPA